MKPAINKAKEYAPIALKVLILGLTLSFILSKILSDKAIASLDLSVITGVRGSLFLLLFLALTLANWCLEIEKWRVLVDQVRSISFTEAARQSLTAFSASVITPNRIGEYAVKAFYFKPTERKKVLLLKLHANNTQLLATLLFGIPSLVYVLDHYKIALSVQRLILASTVALGLVLLLYFLRSRTFPGVNISLQGVQAYYKGLASGLHLKILFLSIGRYLMFSTLFFLLLNFFGAGLDYLPAIPLIASMYLLSSVIPSFALFDFVVKGGVGLWLFSLVGVPYPAILQATFAIWLMSFALPALVGSIFVIGYKFPAE
jgi:hypothetical protein